LIPTDDDYANYKLLGPIVVLDPSQEARQHEHGASLDRAAHRQEEGSHIWSVLRGHVNTHQHVEGKESVVEQIGIELPDLLVAQQDEADHLCSHWLVSEV
jgi:hypothetical protein